MPLDEIAKKTVREEDLETGCTGLILAVSGGADSMAMLFWYASRDLPFPLTVAHVHHGLRAASDGEERLVRETCNRLGIPCRIFRTRVKSEMQRQETVESAARRLRYEFFRTLAAETGASHLATAHTLDDQAETVLLHLIHGAGPRGLCGIFPKRKEGELTLIRPLIRCPRQEVEAYCIAQNISYATDESNKDPSYTRNRIRHTLIPQLKTFNPNILSAVGRTADALQKQQSAMETRAREFLNRFPDAIPAKELKTRPEGEIREILRTWFADRGKTLSAEQTALAMELLRKSEGTAEFDRCWTLHLGQNRLTLRPSGQSSLSPTPVTGEETLLPDGRILRLIRTAVTEQNKERLIPARLPLTARSRRPGDRIRTPGGTKPLSKRMIELKIPFEQRDHMILLTCGDELLWCEGAGVNLQQIPQPGEDGYFVSLSEQ